VTAAASEIFIVVGLGNPGAEYAQTRHNAGFRVIDQLAAELGANYWKTGGGALFAEVLYRGTKLVLCKPQRFMNLSGQPVKGMLTRYRATLNNLLVIHDELDLPPGVLRLKQGGGDAGHRGLRSISTTLGSDYTRLRIGIGRPPGQMPAERFVLLGLKGAEADEFDVTIANAVPIVLTVLQDGLVTAMNRFNGQ